LKLTLEKTRKANTQTPWVGHCCESILLRWEKAEGNSSSIVFCGVINRKGSKLQSVLYRLFRVLPENLRCSVQVKRVNILDLGFVESVLREEAKNDTPIESVIHFAAKKNANESVVMPLHYYENNVVGSLNLLRTM
jgi:UDP-glucose 4-epimerase